MKKTLRSSKDIENFFDAFNRRDWEGVFQYMSDDCVWNASEKRLEGIGEIRGYWTTYHGSIEETLGPPRNVVFGDNIVFLEVRIRMDFVQNGEFFGKPYKKGEHFEFDCADVYELSDEGTISEGRVYSRIH